MLFQAQGLLATGHCYRGCFCDSHVINVPVLAEDVSDDTMDSYYEELWYIKTKGKSHPTMCHEGIGGVCVCVCVCRGIAVPFLEPQC
jgi:hypothetical protein